MDIQAYISSGIIEAYVLGVATPDEVAELNTLRVTHPAIEAAIYKFEAALAQQMMANATPTSNALDSRILHTLQNLPQPTIAKVVPITKAKKTNWWKPAIAAAVLLLITSGILNLVQYNANKKQDALLAATTKQTSLPTTDYAVLKNPAITPIAMMGVGIHSICRCTMYWDKATGKAYIMIHHLVPSNATNNYQLWATVNGKPTNVGIINDKIRDRFIELNNVPQNSNGFLVTLEKVGGSSTPTIEQTYLEGSI